MLSSDLLSVIGGLGPRRASGRGLFGCARHVVYLGGASPPRAEMTGTASRSKGVRREAEFEGSVRQNSDSTNRNRIEGQCSGVTQQRMGRPNSHSERYKGKSGGSRGKETRLTLGGLCICLEEPDYGDGNGAGRVQRSQQRP
jgi:hypothetical protein